MTKYIELKSLSNYLTDEELGNLLNDNRDNPYFEKIVNTEPIKKAEVSQPKNKKEQLKSIKEKVTIPFVDQKEVVSEAYESSTNPKLRKFLDELDQAGITKAEDREYLVNLADFESDFNPNAVNPFGYKGYYQFGNDALVYTGFTKKDFKNPVNQHIAALKLRDLNIIPLKQWIDKPIEINGRTVTATKNILGAMAHNAGAMGTKDFLNKTAYTGYGKRGYKDAYNTPITKYAELFTEKISPLM